jgi:hypothetical protein
MTAKSRALIHAKRAFIHMTPGHVVKTRMTRRVIEEFAEKIGMVYFGYVDQKDDEHRLIRGHTVSGTHVDNHYAVGSLRGYDIALVSREDVVMTRDRKQHRYHWLIATIDLHSHMDVPHVYIGHRNRDEAFKASYEQLHAIDIGMYAPYSSQFMQDYTVYGIPGESIEIEQTITPQIAEVISHHFQQASIEIEDNTIYLYIESQHPSEVLLEKMLSNGLWLAEAIDAAYVPQVQVED